MKKKNKIILLNLVVVLLLAFTLALCWAISAKRIFSTILATIDFLLVASNVGLILYNIGFFESQSVLGRLYIERRDLLERYYGIDAAIHNQRFMQTLTIEARELLIDQADAMKVYLNILNRRIQILEEQEQNKRK